MRQITEAVAYMHVKGVAHRDLKPQNILIDDSGRDGLTVKITDFNVSKVFGSAAGIRKMETHTGTMSYSAPELLSGGEYTYFVRVLILA